MNIIIQKPSALCQKYGKYTISKLQTKRNEPKIKFIFQYASPMWCQCAINFKFVARTKNKSQHQQRQRQRQHQHRPKYRNKNAQKPYFHEIKPFYIFDFISFILFFFSGDFSNGTDAELWRATSPISHALFFFARNVRGWQHSCLSSANRIEWNWRFVFYTDQMKSLTSPFENVAIFSIDNNWCARLFSTRCCPNNKIKKKNKYKNNLMEFLDFNCSNKSIRILIGFNCDSSLALMLFVLGFFTICVWFVWYSQKFLLISI